MKRENYNKYSCELNMRDNSDNNLLWSYYQFLLESPELNLDLSRMKHDLSRGLTINSDIPQRYGLGSSGAIVASVFDRYNNNLNKYQVIGACGGDNHSIFTLYKQSQPEQTQNVKNEMQNYLNY